MASDVGVEVESASTPWWQTSRETMGWIAWTLLADILIFRSWGLTGPAVFLSAVPPLFLVFGRGFGRPAIAIFCGAVLWLVAARLIWSGGVLTTLVGFVFIAALAMAAAGDVPWVVETIWRGVRSPWDGMLRMTEKRIRIDAWRDSPKQYAVSVAVLFPMIAALAFGSIFVLANPDLYDWVIVRWDAMSQRLWDFFRDVSFWEIPFCITALFVAAGLLRARPSQAETIAQDVASAVETESSPSLLYAAFRNTLLTVILLFAVYLCFEFATLWKREFPEGFYYAGYAHEGAAWLTVALALATGIISLIFSGRMLHDPRLVSLQRLAWIWSAENFLLAAAVYNRLFIYVGYNGMTRMRTVAFFGITLVVVGIVLVLLKIAQGHSFRWLLRSQLLAFALAVTAYSLFPVDLIVHRYNASRVAAGYFHPAVMIAVKPIDDEGVFPLLALVDSPDETIRQGVLAMLADRQLALETGSNEFPWHWTRYQMSSDSLARELAKNQDLWAKYRLEADQRMLAIEKFKAYAMQWY